MSKYNPMSKEFQEETKRLGLTGNQLVQKYIQEGKIVNSTDIHRDINNRTLKNAKFKNRKEYVDFCARRRGYENRAECVKEWQWNRGTHSPMSDNEDCSSYLGIYITEIKIGRKLLPILFGAIEKEMPANNPGFEFIVKGGYKIQFKARTLKNTNKWSFRIDYNNIADYFILVAFNDRENLDIIHIWVIKKDDIIRGKKFFDRETISITNCCKKLLEFQKYDQIEKYRQIKEAIEKV